MSRYIRTKDGRILKVEEERDIIYEVRVDIKNIETKTKDYSSCVNPPKQYITKDGIFYDEDIIKQADTIEELCDELVIAYKDCCEKRTYLYSGTIQKFKEGRPNYKNKFFTYYGAIWTSKGLIYVAKMNENGELVLI